MFGWLLAATIICGLGIIFKTTLLIGWVKDVPEDPPGFQYGHYWMMTFGFNMFVFVILLLATINVY